MTKTRLSTADVLHIRRSDEAGDILAARFGCQKSMISLIRSGKRYGWVKQEHVSPGKRCVSRPLDRLEPLPARTAVGRKPVEVEPLRPLPIGIRGLDFDTEESPTVLGERTVYCHNPVS